MEESKLKHLEFIQSVITRMNSNSFQIKSWAVTLVSAGLAIYASTLKEYFILVSLFPAVMMWFLDAYYLMQERKFRGLYNDVAGISAESKALKLFEMRPDLYTGGKYSYWSSFSSCTVISLYFPISIGLIALFILLLTCIPKGV